MGLFDKNPNEIFYKGGKKHFTDVIKNSNSGNMLIWRQPEEDFNTNSTLIVMPGETAIFIKGGNIEKTFEKGTYVLSTNNYPFISRLRNAFTGGISTFNCVVYFVRKADSQEIKWGTETPIQVRDKKWGIRTDIRANGAYKIRIDNPSMFLEKLVGNNVNSLTQYDILNYFSKESQGKIKSIVSQFLNNLEQELIGLDAYIDEISERITPFIDEIFYEYGVKCIKFSIAVFDVDITKYDQIDISQIEKVSKINLSQGDLETMNILGDNWGRQKAANILEELASNPGAGSSGTVGAGMGMGIAAGNIFGTMASQMFAPMNNQNQTVTNKQNNIQSNSSRFSRKKDNENKDLEDPLEAMSKLKKMLDAGYISKEEFDKKKDEILSRI
ncbi:MAG: SPFH domain-containing protein [Erysipelotrichaceae bacterium]|nr:SPFH domain-containing protein [Erysipelotrichaceae bacterium]